MGVTIIKLTSPTAFSGELSQNSTLPRTEAAEIINTIEGVKNGSQAGGLQVAVNEASGVAGTCTVTFTAVVATDVLTVAGVAFACVASGATGDQFNKGASEAASATNCAAKINANATVNKYLAATVNGAIITLTALEKSVLGKLLTCSQTTGASTTISSNPFANSASYVYTSYVYS